MFLTLTMTSNLKEASKIGYPLIKAAAGGGGKGMRVVSSETSLNESLMAAKEKLRLVLTMIECFLKDTLKNLAI